MEGLVPEAGTGPSHFPIMLKRTTAALLLFVASMAGCAPPVNREKLSKEVVSKDPDFGAVLEKRQELSNRIQTYQRELEVRRSTAEKSITQLRKDLADTAASVRIKIDEVKKRIEPDRKRIELALAMAGEELKAKRAQRASLGNQISQLKKSVQTGAAGQDARLNDMLHDAGRLDQEMASLKEHVRLLKIKLLLIKL